MNQARAIIFDLDGTLVDTLSDITGALNRALAEFDLRAVDARDVRRWIGDGVRVLCERALAHSNSSAPPDAFTDRMKSIYESRCVVETRCYPNMLKMLDLLNAERVPCAVLTNKPHAVAMHILDALDLRRRLVAARGYTGEVDKKPSPAQALELAKEMNIEPAEVMVVGDSVVDVQTAHNARMISCAVTWGYQEKSELLAARPDVLIDEPIELKKLLGRI